MEVLKCGFCNFGEEAVDVCGRLFHSKKTPSIKSCTAHLKCMQYSADLTQYKSDHFGGFKIDKVLKEMDRGKRLLKCSQCIFSKRSAGWKRRHLSATAGCAVASCQKNFHFYCANNSKKCINKRYVFGLQQSSRSFVLYRVFCSREHEELYRRTIKEYVKEMITRKDSDDDDSDEDIDTDSNCYINTQMNSEIPDNDHVTTYVQLPDSTNQVATKILKRQLSVTNSSETCHKRDVKEMITRKDSDDDDSDEDIDTDSNCYINTQMNSEIPDNDHVTTYVQLPDSTNQVATKILKRQLSITNSSETCHKRGKPKEGVTTRRTEYETDGDTDATGEKAPVQVNKPLLDRIEVAKTQSPESSDDVENVELNDTPLSGVGLAPLSSSGDEMPNLKNRYGSGDESDVGSATLSSSGDEMPNLKNRYGSGDESDVGSATFSYSDDELLSLKNRYGSGDEIDVGSATFSSSDDELLSLKNRNDSGDGSDVGSATFSEQNTADSAMVYTWGHNTDNTTTADGSYNQTEVDILSSYLDDQKERISDVVIRPNDNLLLKSLNSQTVVSHLVDKYKNVAENGDQDIVFDPICLILLSELDTELVNFKEYVFKMLKHFITSKKSQCSNFSALVPVNIGFPRSYQIQEDIQRLFETKLDVNIVSAFDPEENGISCVLIEMVFPNSAIRHNSTEIDKKAIPTPACSNKKTRTPSSCANKKTRTPSSCANKKTKTLSSFANKKTRTPSSSCANKKTRTPSSCSNKGKH
ncbi:uncharacterized protein LOC126810947 isoform X1 [Patella vulgata]|uniref:uncharacterized protein LOC126810947 isoform X1 n=1 Tax=Patella vulgata TaxID=6465 RepID=UPI0024A86B45|nr:uncharacterized protein LOC126810947 isoform X1 [Patella vulgata]